MHGEKLQFPCVPLAFDPLIDPILLAVQSLGRGADSLDFCPLLDAILGVILASVGYGSFLGGFHHSPSKIL